MHRRGREGEPDRRHHALAPAEPEPVAESMLGWIGKTWSSAVIRKILSSGFLRADQTEGATGRTQPLQGTDQHTESGRVEEVDPPQVHDDVTGPAVDQLDEPFP